MKLEERYIVIKRKWLKLLTDEAVQDLNDILESLRIAKMKDIDTGTDDINCLVIEKDWPEYEPTLKLLSERVDAESRIKEEEEKEDSINNGQFGVGS